MFWPRKKKMGAPVVLFADPLSGMELARRIAERRNRGQRALFGFVLKKTKGAPCS